jgi:hypothetical protein
MEALRSSKKSVLTRAIRRNIPKTAFVKFGCFPRDDSVIVDGNVVDGINVMPFLKIINVKVS